MSRPQRGFFVSLLLCVALAASVLIEGQELAAMTSDSAGLTARTPMLPAVGAPSARYSTVVDDFDLVLPSGNRIYGLIRRPDPGLYPTLAFPAVVYVPGGINAGRLEAAGSDGKMLTEAGVVLVSFNAEGRVHPTREDLASEGEIDQNGFRDQDGLAAVVEYVQALPDVIGDNVGLWSQSYGITMVAGCVARHPELGVPYIVDGEGPSESFVTCQEPRSLDDDPLKDRYELIYGILGHYSLYRDPSADNASFWEEREALRFIGEFTGRYLRLQATWDHAQPPDSEKDGDTYEQPPLWWHNKHAMDMVNAAVAGGVPWVRVNLPAQGNGVNATYAQADPPAYLPGQLADAPWGVRAVLEMAAMGNP